jgi:hypothetical protein
MESKAATTPFDVGSLAPPLPARRVREDCVPASSACLFVLAGDGVEAGAGGGVRLGLGAEEFEFCPAQTVAAAQISTATNEIFRSMAYSLKKFKNHNWVPGAEERKTNCISFNRWIFFSPAPGTRFSNIAQLVLVIKPGHAAPEPLG